jgi:hypothetical protein
MLANSTNCAELDSSETLAVETSLYAHLYAQCPDDLSAAAQDRHQRHSPGGRLHPMVKPPSLVNGPDLLLEETRVDL